MRITVITACRNAAKTIRMALESVATQRTDAAEGRVEIEHIVVDGGSTDGTLEEIAAHELRARDEGRVDFSFKWISEPDKGLYDALNKGIRMATGDVVGICNADDVLSEEGILLEIAGALDDHRVEAVYADVRFVSEGDGVEELRKAPAVRYCTGRFFRNWMFRFATFPAHPSTFVRRSCFEKYGLYSCDYRICADFEMMLRLFYKNGIRTRYLPICTHVMRTGGLSTGGWKVNVEISREDLRALKANGVWSCLPFIYLRYFAKIWGFVLRRRGCGSE